MTFRHPVAKLRFVERAPRQEEWRALHRAAERRVPDAEKAFTAALADLRRATPLAEIRAALERGAPEIAVAAFPWAVLERSLEARLLPILQGLAEKGGAVAVGGLERHFRRQFEVRKADPVKAGFDLINPEVLAELARHGAELVTLITNETRAAIQQVVLSAQQQGLDVREQAARIASTLRRSVGLNAPQARALSNYEAGLREAGRSESDIRDLVGTRRDRMIQQRGRTIARHETLRASNSGQQNVWRQATTQGLLPVDQKRKWLTQGGNFACPICEPMNGQVRGLNEEFESPHNGARALYPPMHVACVCTTVLDFD